VFSKLVTLASLSHQSEVQYNSVGTLGQVYLVGTLSKMLSFIIGDLQYFVNIWLQLV